MLFIGRLFYRRLSARFTHIIFVNTVSSPRRENNRRDQTLTVLALYIPFFAPPTLKFRLLWLNCSSRITSRFRWIAGRLSPDVTPQVCGLIVSSRSYEVLEEAIITLTALAEDHHIRKMLQGAELGNRKASELLWEMWRLKGAPFGYDAMLGDLWLQRLPPHLSPSLSANRKYSLERAAEISEDIMLRFSSGVSAVNTFVSPKAASSPSQDELTIILMRIGASVQRLTFDRNR